MGLPRKLFLENKNEARIKATATRVTTKALTVYPGIQTMWNSPGNFRNQKAKTAGNKHYDCRKDKRVRA